MPSTLADDTCSSFALPPDRVDEIDHWLAQVRSAVPMAQPTAYRLARELARGRSSVIRLTEDVRARLGHDPEVWQQDLDDLYRQGLLAMWMALGTPTRAVLVRVPRRAAPAASTN